MTTVTETTHISDFRMLAKAYPETRHTGHVLSCTIGYSIEQHRLIRYAELPRSASPKIKRWESIAADFERTPDSREETLGIVDHTAQPSDTRRRMSARDGMAEVERLFLVDGTDLLNREHRSIGVVRPTDVAPYWTAKGQELTAQGLVGQPLRLRVTYRTEDGRRHDQTILDWQYYEGARRFATEYAYSDPHAEVITRLTDPEWDSLFVVGNLKAYRRAFVVVGVLQSKRQSSRLTLNTKAT